MVTMTIGGWRGERPEADNPKLMSEARSGGGGAKWSPGTLMPHQTRLMSPLKCVNHRVFFIVLLHSKKLGKKPRIGVEPTVSRLNESVLPSLADIQYQMTIQLGRDIFLEWVDREMINRVTLTSPHLPRDYEVGGGGENTREGFNNRNI